jgi:hypothetical protein
MHACWVVDAYSITFSNCTATLWLQDIEVGKQKHLHVYQADQLNFRQGVGPQTGNLFQDNLINFFINIINITEKNGYGGLYQWPLICFSILFCLRNFIKKMVAILNKMATISCVDKKTSRPTEHAQHCGIVFKILYAKSTFFEITLSFLVRIWSSRYQIKDILKICHHFLCRQKNITSNRTCTTLWYCLQNFVRISFLV